MRTDKILGGLVAVFVCAFLLAECHNTNTGTVTIVPGGGTNGSGGSNVSRGVMKKGSVIVNGVTFSVSSAATITHDESPAGEALLQDGMTVKVRGSVSSDNTSGTAAKISVDSEMRGTISAKGVDSITLLNQQAFVDSRTVYTNVANFQGLIAGQWVEVHGIRDASGRLLATRVEVLFAAAGPPVDRLKGIVEAPFTGGNPPALTFVLRGLTVVTTQGTQILPAGTAINSGDHVVVNGFVSGTTINAGRIDRDDLENTDFEPQENEGFQVQGFVSGFTALGADFTIDGVATHLTGTATFEGGLAADLINNVRVEAEGHVSSGVFLAGKIKFDDAARIEANADLAGSANVLGKTVVTTSLTDLAGLTGGVAGIAQFQGLTVRGFANPDGSITATRIEGQSNPVDARRIIIQGVVDSFSAPQSTVTVMGITISATTFELNEQPVPADQFFSQLTVGRTVVRGRGSFNAATSTLTADAVGIE